MFTMSKILRLFKKLFRSVLKRKPKRLNSMDIDEYEYIENKSVFSCQICFSEVQPGDGIILKNCSHKFCKDCITNIIKFALGPEVNCPYISDDHESCKEIIQDREVRCFISSENYNRHLERSLNLAELLNNFSYHCKTPNCIGWVEIRSKNVKRFRCPACKKINCIPCEAVHEHYTCFQYKALRNSQNQSSTFLINRMMKEKRIMKCPRCGILVEKNQGCNHMTCTKCHREFQWTGINRT